MSKIIDITIPPATSPSTNFMNDLLSLSHVPRWVVVRTLRPQSVADHSFRVAVIAKELVNRIRAYNIARAEASGDSIVAVPLDEFAILWWALIHDSAESVIGDIPSHVKDFLQIPSIVDILADIHIGVYERYLVKLADAIEAYTFIHTHKSGAHSHRVAFNYVYPVMLQIVRHCPFRVGATDTLAAIVGTMCDEIIREDGRDHFDSTRPAPDSGQV